MIGMLKNKRLHLTPRRKSRMNSSMDTEQRPDTAWFHIIWNTLGSWLPGDPRGFRNRDHRIHSSGDYRHPPPSGEHAGLLQYNIVRARPAVSLPTHVRPMIVEAVIEALRRRNGSPAAITVGKDHVHLLVDSPSSYEEVKQVIGKVKTVASLAIREHIPGSIWSRGCLVKRVSTLDHLEATRRYITEKQERGAYVWDKDKGTWWMT